MVYEFVRGLFKLDDEPDPGIVTVSSTSAAQLKPAPREFTPEIWAQRCDAKLEALAELIGALAADGILFFQVDELAFDEALTNMLVNSGMIEELPVEIPAGD